ncbi:LPS-assembly protein LptD [Aurantiacibacter gangjinensis]|uniref:LPS-assembly protein LptD n=1 Tax=Aurantiacibacter gangjinensis TaxID=502682 RepID=A0A0G9MRE5_9SPHN|nr:LPS assembly protein LptD [Aurantiacibacter gangjinensis]APE26840.1 Outer membrane protein Imp/ Organic solvent tolerance protein precursor [Aurantiacibacter gangjinensis]KLE33316.1 organic solvent tolerance protein [Aurantiacibacter gangjinensis]
MLRRFPSVRVSTPGLACAMLCASPALAQEGAGPGVEMAQEEGGIFDPEDAGVELPDISESPFAQVPDGEGPREIGFEANELRYDETTDTVTASGDVILRSGDQSVRANEVVWNRLTGEIVAAGAIRLVDENGNQLFTDRLVLTDELEAGAMTNLLLAFRQGGRLAAEQASRAENGDIELNRAAYSSCAVVDPDGCDRSPSWRVTAERVYYDQDTQRIRFRDAYLELFGARILPLPGLTVRADGSADSGFFIPDIAFTASNGVEISDSYYWRIADNRDLTVTGYLYTDAAPMVSGQYRQLTGNGAFQVTGYATYGSRIPLGSTTETSEQDFRGYFFANGRFQLDEHWTAQGSLRLASDRTFLRRYDITREDRLRSVVELQRIDDNSFVSIAGWGTQALLVSTPQGEVPLALPLIDARYRLEDPLLGGTVELQANTLAITRAEGQDTRRAFAGAQWDLRRITGLGQEVTFTALVRGDVYHSDDNLLTSVPSYRGESGWQARGVATAAVDVKWPLIGDFLGGTQILTPRVQLVASPDIENLDIPNEDARAIDLEDSNLFALNRFPGYDRVEDGVRVTYGADWQANFPGWRLHTTIGQSYRLTDAFDIFPDGTGLNEQFSDFVGRTEVRYQDFLKFTHRYRLDKDSLSVRRNEIDATVGSAETYAEIGYLRLDRDIPFDLEDLQDREELRVAGRFAFAGYWSIFGSAVVNLTDREEDPTFTSDGFEPLRTRLGIAYADDCLEFGFTWRRDFIELADAQSGSSFRLYFSLRNLGFN